MLISLSQFVSNSFSFVFQHWWTLAWPKPFFHLFIHLWTVGLKQFTYKIYNYTSQSIPTTIYDPGCYIFLFWILGCRQFGKTKNICSLLFHLINNLFHHLIPLVFFNTSSFRAKKNTVATKWISLLSHWGTCQFIKTANKILTH